jgi:hypothetical protein
MFDAVGDALQAPCFEGRLVVLEDVRRRSSLCKRTGRTSNVAYIQAAAFFKLHEAVL